MDILFQGGLIIFHRKQIVGMLLLHEKTGGLLLGMQRISGDDTTGKVKIFQQGSHGGNFITFGGDGLLGDYDAFFMEKGGYLTRCVCFPSVAVDPRAVLPSRAMALPATGAWVINH